MVCGGAHSQSGRFWSPDTGDSRRVSDNLKLIEAAGKAGLLTQLHAEDAALLAGAMDRLVAQGRTALVGQNFADSHPVEAEEVATQGAVGFAEYTGSPVYLVHMSSERAMRVAEAGRARGLPVFTEVRFIYLHLTHDAFNRPDGRHLHRRAAAPQPARP